MLHAAFGQATCNVAKLLVRETIKADLLQVEPLQCEEHLRSETRSGGLLEPITLHNTASTSHHWNRSEKNKTEVQKSSQFSPSLWLLGSSQSAVLCCANIITKAPPLKERKQSRNQIVWQKLSTQHNDRFSQLVGVRKILRSYKKWTNASSLSIPDLPVNLNQNSLRTEWVPLTSHVAFSNLWLVCSVAPLLLNFKGMNHLNHFTYHICLPPTYTWWQTEIEIHLSHCLQPILPLPITMHRY